MADIIPEVRLSFRVPHRLRDGRGIIAKGVQSSRDNAKATILRLTKQVFREKKLLATRRLFRSLKVVNRISGSGWYAIAVEAQGEPSKYLPYVEAGLPPGRRINKNELLKWMRAKGIHEAALNNIARSLRRYGYEGKFPMREAQRRIRPVLRRQIERAVTKATKKWAEG